MVKLIGGVHGVHRLPDQGAAQPAGPRPGHGLQPVQRPADHGTAAGVRPHRHGLRRPAAELHQQRKDVRLELGIRQSAIAGTRHDQPAATRETEHAQAHARATQPCDDRPGAHACHAIATSSSLLPSSILPSTLPLLTCHLLPSSASILSSTRGLLPFSGPLLPGSSFPLSTSFFLLLRPRALPSI